MKSRCAIRLNRQQGFSMILAVFIVVIMSMLAATMLRVSKTEVQAATHETLAVRAFYGAEAAVQWGMNQLFLNLTNTSPSCVDVESGYPDGVDGNFDDAYMRQCSIIEHVVCRSKSITGVLTAYHVAATVECGDDIYTARRTVEMEGTRLENNTSAATGTYCGCETGDLKPQADCPASRQQCIQPNGLCERPC